MSDVGREVRVLRTLHLEEEDGRRFHHSLGNPFWRMVQVRESPWQVSFGPEPDYVYQDENTGTLYWPDMDEWRNELLRRRVRELEREREVSTVADEERTVGAKLRTARRLIDDALTDMS